MRVEKARVRLVRAGGLFGWPTYEPWGARALGAEAPQAQALARETDNLPDNIAILTGIDTELSRAKFGVGDAHERCSDYGGIAE